MLKWTFDTDEKPRRCLLKCKKKQQKVVKEKKEKKLEERNINEAKILEDTSNNIAVDSGRESNFYDSDSSLSREEIANLDEIIDCFTNENYFLTYENNDTNNDKEQEKEITPDTDEMDEKCLANDSNDQFNRQSPMTEDDFSVISSNRSSYKESSVDSESPVFEIELSVDDPDKSHFYENLSKIRQATKTCELTFVQKPVLEEKNETCLSLEELPAIIQHNIKKKQKININSDASEGYESSTSILTSEASSQTILSEASCNNSNVKRIIRMFDGKQDYGKVSMSNKENDYEQEKIAENERLWHTTDKSHKEYDEDEKSISFFCDSDSSSGSVSIEYQSKNDYPLMENDNISANVVNDENILNEYSKTSGFRILLKTSHSNMINDEALKDENNIVIDSDDVKAVNLQAEIKENLKVADFPTDNCLISNSECLEDWNDTYLSDTDEDEEIKEILAFITTSCEEKCNKRRSKSQSKHSFFHHEENYEDIREKYEKRFSSCRSVSPLEGPDLSMPIMSKSMAMYPIFDAGLKYAMPSCTTNVEENCNKKINFENLLSGVFMKDRRSKSVDKYGIKSDNKPYRRRSKSTDELESRYHSSRNAFKEWYQESTAMAKKICQTSFFKKTTENKSHQGRNSRFFTDDFVTNLPYTKSWLDKNLFPNLESRSKFTKLLRSKSFCFPKINSQKMKKRQKTNSNETQSKPIISSPKLIASSLPKCASKMESRRRQSIVNFFHPKLKPEINNISKSQDILSNDGKEHEFLFGNSKNQEFLSNNSKSLDVLCSPSKNQDFLSNEVSD